VNAPVSWPPPEPDRKIKLKKGPSRTVQIVYSLPASNELYDYLRVTATTRKSDLRMERKVPLLAQVVAAPSTIGRLEDWPADDGPSFIPAKEGDVQPRCGVSAACDDEALYLAFSAAKSLKPECVQFLLDLNNDGLINAFGEDGFDFWAQASFTPGAGRLLPLHAVTRRPIKDREIEGTATFVSETPDLLICKVRLPYSRLGQMRPGPGDGAGLGVLFNNRNGEPTAWPPAFRYPRKDAEKTGQVAFAWRKLDEGKGPVLLRRSLPKCKHIQAIVTHFPPGRAFRYGIFATDRMKPPDDLSSPEWVEAVPLKVGSGLQVDRVDMHARHFITRFRSLLSDPSFEGVGANGPARPEPGQADRRVWVSDAALRQAQGGPEHGPRAPFCSVDTSTFRSGNASAFISAVGRKGGPGDRWTNWTQTVPAEPDTEYTLSGHVKIKGIGDTAPRAGVAGQANIAAHTFQSGHPEAFSNPQPARATPGLVGWQPLQMTFRTGPDEDRIQVFCDMDMNGAAWFDDVYLIEGAFPSGAPEIVHQQFLKKPGWFEKWPQFVRAVSSNE
jgi:hypothetical protein